MNVLKSILVATDLSDSSDEIMRAAASVAQLSGAKLHILHVFEFEDKPPAEREARTFPERIAAGERALDEQLVRTIRGNVATASSKTIIYTAHKAIRDRARDVAADVVVFGRHRHYSVADRFLGGTADRVLRSADMPCLIISDPLSLPLRKIVVPIDMSEPALAALDVALNWVNMLAADQPSEVVILYVIPQVYDYTQVPVDRSAAWAHLTTHVAAARERVPMKPEPNVREEVRWGDSIATEIQAFVQEERADLVVLGTHGYGAVKRTLIGSVAGAIARNVATPVLLVPPSMWRGVA